MHGFSLHRRSASGKPAGFVPPCLLPVSRVDYGIVPRFTRHPKEEAEVGFNDNETGIQLYSRISVHISTPCLARDMTPIIICQIVSTPRLRR